MNKKLNRTIEFLNTFLELKFESYLALQDFVEEHISNAQKEIDKKYAEVDEIENIDEWNAALNSLEQELGLDLFKFEHEFPNRIRYSAIIQTYSVLEVYLKWLCDNLKKIKEIPFGISDLKGNSDLEKGKLFLERVYELDFNNLNPEWKFINDMRKIRNQIIHKNGDFQMKDAEILKIINQTDGLGIMWDDIEPEMEADKDYEIKINSNELNRKFIRSIRAFFDKIVEEIKRKEINTA